MFATERCPCCDHQLTYADAAADEFRNLSRNYAWDDSEWTIYRTEAKRLEDFDFYCVVCDIMWFEQDVSPSGRRQMPLGAYQTGEKGVALGQD